MPLFSPEQYIGIFVLVRYLVNNILNKSLEVTIKYSFCWIVTTEGILILAACS